MNRGFNIKFANGYSVSVQFGPAHNCDNRDLNEFPNATQFFSCKNAECAVMNSTGQLLNLGDDDILGYQTPEQVLKLLNETAARPKEL